MNKALNGLHLYNCLGTLLRSVFVAASNRCGIMPFKHIINILAAKTKRLHLNKNYKGYG